MICIHFLRDFTTLVAAIAWSGSMIRTSSIRDPFHDVAATALHGSENESFLLQISGDVSGNYSVSIGECDF
ncbi:hypothetical protein V22_35710 [Calycomorphotria hydatis]|uniref:Uncharacterized protein n=1 Tax=Calycomorphotria hydatis TaxID=2528027 RepID=A0A517TD60_9PLAN|nr:hypothetical protein V22_35710 [Calycomorphotria hydatis]